MLDYSGPSPAAGVEGMVNTGYNGGDWLGKRITSSTANANRNFALAVSDNSRLAIPFSSTRLFAGEAVDTTAVLVKFTHRVDLDLDGVITTNDATIFNSSYSEGGASRWGIGDVDFDGLFTTNDATIFNSYYNEVARRRCGLGPTESTPQPRRRAQDAPPPSRHFVAALIGGRN